MTKNDNYFNISLFVSILLHFFLILILLFYQNKSKNNILKINMSIPAKSIEVDAVGLPNILKKDIDQMNEKNMMLETQKDIMHLPSKEKILVNKMAALKKLEENLAKENYLKKLKIIKGLKVSPGKELSTEKPDEKKTTSDISNNSLTSTNSNDEELFKYIDVLKSYIKKYWSIPTWFYAEGLNTIISLSLKDDGEIKETRIYKSSGNDYFDNYALKAIKEAAPFPSPPKTLLDISDNDGLLITFP